MTSETKDKTTEAPTPEVLQPKADDASPTPVGETVVHSTTSRATQRPRHVTYRPSHKATFIGLAVVAGILVINAGILAFVMRSQASAEGGSNQGEVTISPAALDKLGVSRNTVGDLGTELLVNPNARFNGTLTVAHDVEIAGQLRLNSKFSAAEASLAKLEAGNTSLSQLNVNGDTTSTNLNLRKDLTVVGSSRLQGAVTISQLLTVNNNVNISGSLAVGGALSVRSLQVGSLVSDTTLTIGGHIITRGSAPGVGPGSALGSNGTVSISGNDTSGTVAVNIGAGGGGGVLAQVAFRNQYGITPHVVVTAIGQGADNIYVNRSIGGFSIGVNGSIAPGGYAFDYIVMQ